MAKILVVDDIAINRQVLEAVLTYDRHEVLEASDGRQALALVKTKRPDVIISDIVMPHMTGYELVKQLRSDPYSANIPIIFNTASFLKSEAQALAQSLGASLIL